MTTDDTAKERDAPADTDTKSETCGVCRGPHPIKRCWEQKSNKDLRPARWKTRLGKEEQDATALQQEQEKWVHSSKKFNVSKQINKLDIAPLITNYWTPLTEQVEDSETITKQKTIKWNPKVETIQQKRS